MTTRVLRLALGVAVLATACTTPKQYFPGPEGRPYSSAILAGNTLYVAGHIGLDAETGRPPEDARAEAERMLDRFTETMARARFTMDELVQVQVHCSDVSLYDLFNEVYSRRFAKQFPTRAFIGSGPLLYDARFEMVGIAVR